MSDFAPMHTHETEGGTITHEHCLGRGRSLEPIPFDQHTHLVILSERNYVHVYTGTPIDGEGEL